MAITRLNPNTVYLGGGRVQINDLACSEAITPGHLVDQFNNSGTIRWRKHATAGGACSAAVHTDMTMLNKGPDDASAVGDLIEVSVLQKGAHAWMLIASGQNISAGDKLESAGNGTLRALASGVALFKALENKPSVLVLTRIRVEAL